MTVTAEKSENVKNEFKPSWTGEIEGYVVNWYAKNGWKVASFLPELDDVKQEAYLVFAHVPVEYPDIDNPRWFMSMFKQVFSCRMIDVQRRNVRYNKRFTEMVESEDTDGAMDLSVKLGDLENDFMVERLVEDADGEVKEVLQTILNMPSEVFSMLEQAWTKPGKPKFMSNQMLCSLLGKDPKKTNLVKKVEDHFISN